MLRTDDAYCLHNQGDRLYYEGSNRWNVGQFLRYYPAQDPRNRTSRSSGKHSCFIFWTSRVQISAQRPAMLAGIFVVFFSPSRQMLV
jgi:hypothetical protein